MNQEVSQHESGNMNASQISLSDLQIPRVMAMQQLSKQVSDGTAAIGDFVASDDGTILGSIKKPLKFVPLFCKKTYRVHDEETKEFVAFEPYDFDRPYRSNVGAKTYINTLVYNFYCILPEFPTMPYIIAFKGMSKNAGAMLFTKTEVSMRMAKMDPWEKMFELTGDHIKEKNKNYIQLAYTNSKAEIGADTKEVIGNWINMLGLQSKKGQCVSVNANPAPKQIQEPVDANQKFIDEGKELF